MGKFVRRYLTACCALVFFAGYVYSAETPVRMTSAVRENPEQGLRLSMLSTQKGNLQAQETQAIKYFFGDGVPHDYAEAVKWVRLATEEGKPLPRTLSWNLRVNRDAATKGHDIIEGLRLGAAKGHPLAQELLGVELCLGEAAPRDLEQAAKYLLLAAEKGLPRSQCLLGYMYARGEGVPQDYIEAIAWFEKAARQGFPEAQHELGWMYANGRGVLENVDEAARWLRLAAARSHGPSKSLLWLLAEKGRVAAENAEEMEGWLKGAALSGNAEAQFKYGEMLLRMEGAPNHLKEFCFYRLASFWYQKAARQGRADAQYRLAQMNLNGQGGGVDYRTAFIWASLAKAQGHEEAGRLMEKCMNFLDTGQQADARKAAAKLQAKIGEPGGVNPSLQVSESYQNAEESAEKS